MLKTVRNAMAPYDDFAWFYNRYWNGEFHSLAFPILQRIWLDRVASRAASSTSAAAMATWRVCSRRPGMASPA